MREGVQVAGDCINGQSEFVSSVDVSVVASLKEFLRRRIFKVAMSAAVEQEQGVDLIIGVGLVDEVVVNRRQRIHAARNSRAD